MSNTSNILDNQVLGSNGAPDTPTINYAYKAEKYHYKIQARLLQMQKENKAVPVGYEQYLQPFKPLTE